MCHFLLLQYDYSCFMAVCAPRKQIITTSLEDFNDVMEISQGIYRFFMGFLRNLAVSGFFFSEKSFCATRKNSKAPLSSEHQFHCFSEIMLFYCELCKTPSIVNISTMEGVLSHS